MNILIVKLSSLGDVVHTLPVVQDMLAALPGANIDWVVEKSFAPLLAHCPGVHRVVSCELRRWRKSPLSAVTRTEWNAFKAQLRSEAYDAVLDLQGLAKSALVARLARMAPSGQRFALANQTEGSAYEAPSRWVADVAIRVEPRIHAVQRGRELAAQALGYHVEGPAEFGLNPPAASVLPEFIDIKNIANMVLLAHGTSRADKQWPLASWVALGRRLVAAGYTVGLLHGSAGERAASQALAATMTGSAESPASAVASQPGAPLAPAGCVHVLPQLPLDELVTLLAASAGVIGVDSGVSHIAVALKLPHVQIYNFDTAWRTGPPALAAETPPGPGDGASQQPPARQTSVFAQPTPGVDAVWQAWLACRMSLRTGV